MGCVDLGVLPKIFTEDDQGGDVGNCRTLRRSLWGVPSTGSGSASVRSVYLILVPKILTKDDQEGDEGNRCDISSVGDVQGGRSEFQGCQKGSRH